MNYTKEEMEYLSNFEYHFKTALNNGFCRIDARPVLAEFAKIYKRAFNKDSKIIGGCSRCVLNDIRVIAKAYFADVEEMAKNEPVEAVEATEAVIDTTTQPIEEKPATKKKTAKKSTNKKK